MNADGDPLYGDPLNGCESCNYTKGYALVNGSCEQMCEGYSSNYYCQAKHACCSGAQACDTLSDLDQCEFIFQH
jgi:hypothetical protein